MHRLDTGVTRAREYVFGNQEPPDVLTVELLAVCDALHEALEEPPATSKITIYTDSQAAVRVLRAPHTDPIARKIAEASRRLRTVHAVETRVWWVPGHCRVPGNEAAHAAASAILTSNRRSDIATFVSLQNDGKEDASFLEQRQRRRQLREHLKQHTPKEDPLPAGLSRACQVLVHKARTGTALTPDVLARWRAHKERRRLPENTTEEIPPVQTSCPACKTAAAPTIRHLLWECPKYAALRRKHRGQVASFEEWIRPSAEADTVLRALFAFAAESGILRMV